MELILLLLFVNLTVLVFTYTNGFHDAANAIATVVGTRVLTPRQAVILGAITNFLGALSGVAVAKTIGAGLVDTNYVTTVTILCAMLGGIFWNVLTWRFGLPSSSSHALIGGLLGAAFASAHNKLQVIKWSFSKLDPKTGHTTMDGLYPKVIIPMVSSPILGFIGGMLVMTLLFAIIRHMRPRLVERVFGKLQLLSATYMGWSHGFADGQKTMGIMALACYAATRNGDLKNLPPWLGFLNTPEFEIKFWVKCACGIAMAIGTYSGGWRIIATLGRKMVRLRPVHGFAAEATGATLLLVTGKFGMPISTTHAITTAIMGVGCARRFSALNWTLVERILWTWVLTIPATGLLAYAMVWLTQVFGWTK
ncbi:MAG TPA: inorganic phosphate transporter [Verrucomicrobiae bacterium]|jgi:PiT family inorganic phosphate transporter|nr:inorganic phosphate transporter [Verrucomicrobiae bacterium]